MENSMEKIAIQLLLQCESVALASVTGTGYPRICEMEKVFAEGLRKITFITAKASAKVGHYEQNNKASVSFYAEETSVSLTGIIKIIKEESDYRLWLPLPYLNRLQKSGIDKYCVLVFITREAMIYSEGNKEFITYS